MFNGHHNFQSECQQDVLQSLKIDFKELNDYFNHNNTSN